MARPRRSDHELVEWRVTINERWTYEVMADIAAEAASLAVFQWRKDEKLDLSVRQQFVSFIQTECLTKGPDRQPRQRATAAS